MPKTTIPTVLTIAGSDNYGGAGIEIDSKTIHALGGYAFNTTTALTAQNSTGVKEVLVTPAYFFEKQLESILSDIKIDAVKIGMLGNSDILNIVIKVIKKYRLKNIVLDTVLVSSSGKDLLDPKAINTLIEELFPLVDLITPNIPETNKLIGKSYLGKDNEIDEMANALLNLGANNVLIKGGHSPYLNIATDYLVLNDLTKKSFTSKKIITTHTHGTGCLLSSAIATNLALGNTLIKSVENSKKFLFSKLKDSSSLYFNYIEKKTNRKEPIF
ncbi:MAG: bifunctional hydroxymethylpyrimidine kinase/phosphomethylpyrimidine kinase [Campylobacteraceae bacterium]|jgi:hydroxymethylpyrimidine/phosphomethylpyrimidine kinase|nr:bifunctional hydroxymethylpyrimidine kinase/phosphomethylpyrimidine kinase [Campylobacteraceae bacterium]MBT4029882.1 bifunctional hydroxymethylpyrimidine kinase/phosphomethylpyrimidine kinase [Campylobacteraceae bacterium]MBT4179300.1 bifunctional hydroxymethylpyrimidine kinase/phosphomethylpyrimidine kinase [Campylobacteraceae bacterium]MBT4572445.1 bifunctional hydroxymethylpyrimidine kinase/phosphomethylpyrimidine kinase [Campylobacteraceae bacterium]MBT4708579.1 bifunctional hydroxymeth